MALRTQADVPGDTPPIISIGDSITNSRHSVRALLFGLVLWLVVRPILCQISDLVLVRRRMERLDHHAPFRNGHKVKLGGIATYAIEKNNARRLILYLHGGGFFMRPASAHVAFLQRLCADTEAAGIMPDYRLTPEHPFPQGIDDCMHAYQTLLARGVPASAMVIAGESAGGTLVLSLLMRLRDAGLPLPAGAVLISAATDLAGVGLHDSYIENGARDALVPPEALPRIVNAYAAGRYLSDPQISPLRGDFIGLPPLHFVASNDEVLRDDSALAVAKARLAGVAVEFKLWRGLMHAFPLFHRLPEAKTACTDIARFVCKHTADCARLPALTFTDEIHS